MGTSGPSGGFDIQNFFKTPPPSSLSSYTPPSAPYPPPNHPYQTSSSHPYPLNNFAPSNSYTSGNSFTSLPGSYPYNSQQTPGIQSPGPYNSQQTAGMYHPYMHYPQDHGPRPPPYPASPYPTTSYAPPGPQHGTFSQSQYSSSQTQAQTFSQSQSSSTSNTTSAQSGSQVSAPTTSVPPPPPVHAPSPVSSPPLDGAHLMALLTTQSSAEVTTSKEETSAMLLGPPSMLEVSTPGIIPSDTSQVVSPEVSVPPPAIAPALPTAPPVNLAPTPSRLPGSKPPRGRSLKGEQVVYDVDVRHNGEAQPQLEVSPITVYGSDPVLVLGRQIAVNRSYICYGLRAGTIRILNINTALRVLLRGHSQRVTDMVFFAEDVHLLASASTDGRVFVRKIVEGTSDDGRMEIKDHILVAMQILGDWESVHPRVCWHSQMPDLLVVGIGKYVLTIDLNKLRANAPSGGFTAEDPLVCHVNNPLEGVHVVGEHNADVTDLSVPLWIPTCFASASQDGTVRIWGDKNMNPLSVFVPHHKQPVNSVAFVSAPRRPDHAVLVTAGPYNRELKLWAQSTADGLPSKPGGGNWQCIQTLELKSSASEGWVDKAFFNQVLVVPRASLILLANAKKNAIYVVHLEFGSTAAATRMDYLAEFSVTMPILSLTATSEGVSDGEGTVQVYCVQTQAIQQYALDLCQCLPPPEEPSIDIAAALDKSLMGSQVSSPLAGQTFTHVDSGYPTILNELTTVSMTTNSVTAGPSGSPAGPSVGSAFTNQTDVSTSYEQSSSFSEASVLLEPKVSTKHQAIEADLSETNDALSRFNDAPSAPSVRPVSPAQLPPFLKRQSQSDSPTKVSEDGYVLVSASSAGSGGSPEQPDNGLVQEQPPVESLLTEVGGLDSVSTTSQGGDEVFEKDEDAVLGATSKSGKSLTAQQKSNSERLRTELIVTTESSLVQPESAGVRDGGYDEISVMMPDVKEKIQVSSSLEFSSKEFSWDGNAPGETVPGDEVLQVEDGDILDEREHLTSSPAEEAQEQVKDLSVKVGEATSGAIVPSQSPAVVKGRKNKNKTNVGAAGVGSVPPVSLSSPLAISVSTAGNSTTSEGESSTTANIVPSDAGLAYQVASMQESISQLVAMHKELQKQMTVMVAIPVSKEGKRMESALGQRMEKLLKAHVDAMWARIQEENVKKEKLERDRVQQLTSLLSNSLSKDLPATVERIFKKELTTIGPVIVRLVTPSVEKTTLAAVSDALQKGLLEKVTPQLEKVVATKLEAAVTRQLQTQLGMVLRPALQDALRSSFETAVIPGFERSCQAMFEQIDTTFQRGLAEHTAGVQQQFEASHSALAASLQDTMMSASSLATSLKSELSEGQRKLIALAENAGANAARASLTAVKQSNGGLPDKVLSLQHLEESLDPTIELTRLVNERKLEEAFNKALSLSDVAIVSWLCNQVDLKTLFSMVPLPLSQGVLLSLVQQLGCDLGKDTAHKLEWIREGALALNPKDPVLAPHMRPFLEQLYQNLHRQMHLTTAGGELANSMRLVLHVVNSLLTACK
ncbi:enhancer of mRNA-decapping protein 4 [Marchantia polymorpha subsp. ruderalis]